MKLTAKPRSAAEPMDFKMADNIKKKRAAFRTLRRGEKAEGRGGPACGPRSLDAYVEGLQPERGSARSGRRTPLVGSESKLD